MLGCDPADGDRDLRDRVGIVLQSSKFEGKLTGRDYLTGSDFSVADGYLFTILRWSGRVKLDLSPYKNVTAYMARVEARPKVQEAMKAEGLIQ